MANHRQNSGSDSGSTYGGGLSRAGSSASSFTKPPPSRFAPPAAADPAPPAYTAGGGAAAAGGLAGKRPAPPPPIKPRIGVPAAKFVTALYDYAATAEGDLSFVTGDKIELVKKDGDWWTGRVNGQEGVFPGESRCAKDRARVKLFADF